MADSYNVGQVFGDSAQGFANASVAMPDAQASLALKQQQVQDYKDKSARDSKERDDLAKLANDPMGDINTPQGMAQMGQHLQNLVKTFARNGDGQAMMKAQEDLVALANRSSEIAKRDEEERIAKIDRVGAIFGPVKTEEDLAQAKELLKKTYPNERQYYENLTLPQARQVAAASSQWLQQQSVQSQIAEREERERLRQQDANRRDRLATLAERRNVWQESVARLKAHSDEIRASAAKLRTVDVKNKDALKDARRDTIQNISTHTADIATVNTKINNTELELRALPQEIATGLVSPEEAALRKKELESDLTSQKAARIQLEAERTEAESALRNVDNKHLLPTEKSSSPASDTKTAKPLAPAEFDKQWKTLKPGQSILGPDGKTYTKK